MAERLPRSFFARDTRVVARALVGLVVAVRRPGAPDGVVRARIVETEAYHGRADAASHAHRGLTARTAPMFGPPGHAYVYLIYGMWHCLNVTTMPEGFPAAVLLRAAAIPGEPRAARGPGKLCRALGVDRGHTGEDLVTGRALWIEDDGVRAPRLLGRGPRVNVDYAGAWAARPWRWWWPAHPEVSK